MTAAPRAELATYTVVHIADLAGSPSTGRDWPSLAHSGPHRFHRSRWAEAINDLAPKMVNDDGLDGPPAEIGTLIRPAARSRTWRR